MSVELMKGTGGTLDFAVAGLLGNTSGPHIKLGVRPLMEVHGTMAGDGNVQIAIGYRVRFQGMNGHTNTQIIKAVAEKFKNNQHCSSVKVGPDYCSFMMGKVLTTKLSTPDNLIAVMKAAKQGLTKWAEGIYDMVPTADSITAQPNSKTLFTGFMMNHLLSKGGPIGLDFGDPASDHVPTDQPVVDQYNKKQTGGSKGQGSSAGGAMGSPKTVAKDDTPTHTAPDFTPAKDDEEDGTNLEDLSFDELMKKIGKKN